MKIIINYSRVFDSLSRVARTLLGIPVTSAFVERFFSKTRYIMHPHRRTMGDKNAEDLFFCKENLSFVWGLKYLNTKMLFNNKFNIQIILSKLSLKLKQRKRWFY